MSWGELGWTGMGLRALRGSASDVWGESDLNPVLRANSYTRSKPPKPKERRCCSPDFHLS
jgi:hypothetical protein